MTAQDEYFKRMDREGQEIAKKWAPGFSGIGCIVSVLMSSIGIGCTLFMLWLGLQVLGWLGAYP